MFIGITKRARQGGHESCLSLDALFLFYSRCLFDDETIDGHDSDGRAQFVGDAHIEEAGAAAGGTDFGFGDDLLAFGGLHVGNLVGEGDGFLLAAAGSYSKGEIA